MKRGAVVFALAAAALGCGPKNYVVLLDNPGGGSGQVIVSNQKGQQVLDKSGSATTFDRASRAPSSPWELGVEKIKEVFGGAFGARPPRMIKYTIYFKSGGTTLAAESKETYTRMLAEVSRRPGADATVTGHADRTSTQRWNEVLATKRADKVRKDLIDAGIPLERIEMDSYGETRPAVPTADEIPEPRNRRVEITIR
jgi:peptidoglycan-associated lipoprotein